MSHLNKYRTAGWQRLANEVRTRDKFTCQICKTKPPNGGEPMSVHHIAYLPPYDRPIWLYPMSMLITLCPTCHNIVHRRADKSDILNVILGICGGLIYEGKPGRIYIHSGKLPKGSGNKIGLQYERYSQFVEYSKDKGLIIKNKLGRITVSKSTCNIGVVGEPEELLKHIEDSVKVIDVLNQYMKITFNRNQMFGATELHLHLKM